MEVLKDNGPAVLAEVRTWQALAVDEYERSLPGRHDALRAELTARVLALTGRRVPPENVYADDRLAVAGVDGATFRLHRGGDLVLVRACAYCGMDHFESPRDKRSGRSRVRAVGLATGARGLRRLLLGRPR
jgi:hypothetical protein